MLFLGVFTIAELVLVILLVEGIWEILFTEEDIFTFELYGTLGVEEGEENEISREVFTSVGLCLLVAMVKLRFVA